MLVMMPVFAALERPFEACEEVATAVKLVVGVGEEGLPCRVIGIEGGVDFSFELMAASTGPRYHDIRLILLPQRIR